MTLTTPSSSTLPDRGSAYTFLPPRTEHFHRNEVVDRCFATQKLRHKTILYLSNGTLPCAPLVVPATRYTTL
jgi:hypothetical protein